MTPVFSKFRRYIIIISMLIIMLQPILVKVIFPEQSLTLRPENGVLNLASWDYDSTRITKIGGEWEFYWKELLTEDEIEKGLIPDSIVKIPSVWNSYKINGKNLPGYGYATFRLHVINAKPGSVLGLRIPPMSTSYRMYINHDLVASNGTVGTDQISSIPEYRIQIINYTVTSESFDIIIQISNYTYARGGFWYAPQFGNGNAILGYDGMVTDRDVFLMGSFLFMCLFFMIVFAMRRKEKENLYFSIMCLSVMGRLSVYGSYTITKVPFLSNIEIISRIEYLSIIWLTFTFLLLSEAQYGNILSKPLKRYLWIYHAAFTFGILILPIHYFTKSVYIIEVVCILIASFTIVQIARAYLKGVRHTFIIALSGLFCMICAIHDIMIHNNIITGGPIELLPIGFVVFLFCEGYINAWKYTESKELKEQALIQLEEVSRKERETELKFLKSQIKPHFIHNALNAIISISRTNPDNARTLLLEFSQYLRNCFDFEDLENMVPLEKEINFVHSYLAIEQARFGEKLKIQYDIDDIKIMIPPLILQPLVENAVIHGVRPKAGMGVITVYVKKKDGDVCLGVKDNGAGFPPDKLERLLNETETGRGVGLSNINKRLLKLYQISLTIENSPDEGADVYMRIPCENGGNQNESYAD